MKVFDDPFLAKMLAALYLEGENIAAHPDYAVFLALDPHWHGT